MVRKSFKSAKLFSDSNSLQFASVMAIVMFVILVPIMTYTRPHSGIGIDLPKVSQPSSMPGANRKDAMLVTITRDGRVWFGTDPVYDDDSLPDKIRERLNDRDVERKAYIKADWRARWGAVKPVLDGVRSAGIVRVAFLTDQRHVAILVQ